MRILDSFKKKFSPQTAQGSLSLWAGSIAIVECVSLVTIFTSTPNTAATLLVVVLMFWLAWKRPTVAMGVMMLELLIGSKGYLLQYGGWPSTISVRVLMTAAFLFGWGIHFLQHGRLQEVLGLFQRRVGYLVLFVFIAYATLRGVFIGNQMVMKDANAWMDWVLLVPVLEISWRYKKTLRRDLTPILWVAVFWLALKSLVLEYIFSHGIQFASQPLYLWVRRTGVAEVTLVVGNAFRIFMQSYVYAVAAWITTLAWWLSSFEERPLKVTERENSEKQRATNAKKYVWLMMTASVVVLGLSLSRSFWIGSFVGSLFLVLLLWKNQISWWKRFRGPMTAVAAGMVIIAGVLAVPLPPVNIASFANVFGSRASAGEAAVVSRWNLMPILWRKIMEHPFLGSGFGASVTYRTVDPRILADHADGKYTTYAFEWGWLEHWIKFGIFGPLLIAYLLLSLGFRVWRLEEPLWLRLSCVSSLIALATLHFFTPYLNHPLGIGFLF